MLQFVTELTGLSRPQVGFIAMMIVAYLLIVAGASIAAYLDERGGGL